MRYVTLDLMRGLAALAVLVFHGNYMLGAETQMIAKGYLAVDFFFILSGFVIAANYHVSVRPDLVGRDFVSARIARLWPLFILSTLAGFVAVTMKATRDFGYFDAPNIYLSLALNALMVPSVIQNYGIDRLFYFNAASWSIFFEITVNLLFLGVLRHLSLAPLLSLSCVFAVLLALAGHAHGSLDGGQTTATFHLGALRVLFGFTTGTALYLAHRRLDWNASAPLTVGAVIALCASFLVDGGWLADCLFVIGAYPLLVLLAASGRLGGACERAGSWLGDISYSVYLLQTPAMLFASWAYQQVIGGKIAEFAPWSGLVFVLALLGVSHLCWRYFEQPARNRLRRWLNIAPAPRHAVTEGA